ncbi:interleukin 1 alpha, isoform CRA_b [Rattus norvegicus]|nr:interleukin 1 alpha, isoform CRA_b [Rattus norvegicus]
MSTFTFKESRVVVSATSNKGKILKKRRLSFNQPFTEDDLEAIAHDLEVKFDMYAYSSGGDDSKYPVTLKVSNTQLFVSAQGEDKPVLLKEIPETPKLITGSETDLIFFWEKINSKNYFTSAAFPELLIATKEQSQVHLARGLPSMIDFQIS